jgi:hypothetical protein
MLHKCEGVPFAWMFTLSPPNIMAKYPFLQYLREQRKPIPPVTPVDLAGQTVVVVGANSGVGFECAKYYAKMNPGRLVLACRNRENGEAALVSESCLNHRLQKADKSN